MTSRTLVRLAASLMIVVCVVPLAQADSRDRAATGPRLDVREVARSTLARMRSDPARFGATAADVEELDVTDAYRSSHTGVTHVYLNQQVRGLEVVGANATMSLRADGSMLHMPSRFIRHAESRARGTVGLGPRRALRHAARHLGLETRARHRVLARRGGAERITVLAKGDLARRPITARLVYQPVAPVLRLAWQLEIEEAGERHWWLVTIDAETGRLLERVDYVSHAHGAAGDNGARRARGRDAGERGLRPPVSEIGAKRDGATYRVYALPLESPNDGDRSLVKNPADEIASPYGWHDTDGAAGPEHTTTRGNNVHAYVDYTPIGLAPLPLMDADGGEDLRFDFPIDFLLPPQTWRDAATTNLFYWSNVIHDVLYRYGFDEPAGNFQATNYTDTGQGGDAVRAEAQDGSGLDNANFATPPDGSPPRMQMYLWVTGPGLVDGDLDAGVIIHEYGHGVSNRLTGGPSMTNCLTNAEQGGEGWSDWLAVALTARAGDERKPRGIGTYVLGETDRHQRGIRSTPYSVDKKVNQATYDSIKNLSGPHAIGYVWGTMLWEVYAGLVREHGFNPDVYGSWRHGGNNLAIQLVLDGMKMQPCNPGFVDARDAILAADRALTGGANQCLLWAAFAKRGLGVRAKQGDPRSNVDGKEDFHVPQRCA